jgi:hypothetical protein
MSLLSNLFLLVTPAKAGGMARQNHAGGMKYGAVDAWIPACAGMTEVK